jgi:peptide/nickel transport system permease protein
VNESFRAATSKAINEMREEQTVAAFGPVPKERSVVRRFFRHKMAVIGLVTIVVIMLLAVSAPLVAPRGPYKQNLKHLNQPPDSEYWLGTDELGRDVWARLVFAGRVSGTVGLAATALFVVIGTVLGLISGFYGGRVDLLIQRVTEVFMSLPWLIVIITLVAIFGASMYNIILVIGFLSWTGVCRLVRGQVLSTRELDYTTAARCIGASNMRIIFRHVFPNVLAPVIVAATFGVAASILTETGLSFLGLGVRPPTPSWGNMITQATKVVVMEQRPWQWLPPGLMIAVCVLSINFMGDGLRDALDPKMVTL